MPGIKSLRRIQIGAEDVATHGTAVAATTFMRLNGVLDDQRVVTFPVEDIGILVGADRNYTSKLLGEIQMTGPATFEQLPYILETIVHATPTTDTGSGTGYIREYIFPTLSTDIPESTDYVTYTIEGGDNQEAESMEYSFVPSFKLSGTPTEAWMVDATWRGRQVSTDTFTGLGTSDIPTVDEMLFSKTSLYIANSSTDWGSAISQTLLGATLDVDTGLRDVYTADGQLYFSFIKNVGATATLNITFEHNATAQAQKAIWRAKTTKSIRLAVTGSALTAAGAYTYRTVYIDMAGKWEKFEKLSEQDGNDIVAGIFRVRYNTSAVGEYLKFTIVNELATLP
jgi:hypothetical protein